MKFFEILFFLNRCKNEILCLKTILCDWILLNELFEETQFILNNLKENNENANFKVISLYYLLLMIFTLFF